MHPKKIKLKKIKIKNFFKNKPLLSKKLFSKIEFKIVIFLLTEVNKKSSKIYFSKRKKVFKNF